MAYDTIEEGRLLLWLLLLLLLLLPCMFHDPACSTMGKQYVASTSLGGVDNAPADLRIGVRAMSWLTFDVK
jgi:hypothetical protein